MASKLTPLVLRGVSIGLIGGLIGGLVGGLTGCSAGFSAQTGQSSQAPSNTGQSIGGNQTQQAAFKALQVDGTVSGLFGDGSAKVIEIDKAKMQLVARMPLPLGAIAGLGVAPTPISQIPGATIGLETTSSGSSALTIRIPLAAFMKGVSIGNAATLPNGDPLPAIPGGELPALALNFATVGNGMTLYLDKAVFGIFVDIKSSYMGAFPIQLTIPVKNSTGTHTWGYVSNILPKPSYDGGIFLSLALPDDVARAIDDVL